MIKVKESKYYREVWNLENYQHAGQDLQNIIDFFTLPKLLQFSDINADHLTDFEFISHLTRDCENFIAQTSWFYRLSILDCFIYVA